MGDNTLNSLGILQKYMEYYDSKKTNNSDKSVSENIDSNAKGNDAEGLYKLLMKEVSKGDISILHEYTDSLVTIKRTQPKFRKYISDVLTTEESLRGFRKARKNIADLYPLLIKLDKEFNVKNYYELTLKPDAYLYGVFIVGDKGVLMDRKPLSNEEIQSILELFINLKDNDHLTEWIISILMFLPEEMTDRYRDQYSSTREELRSGTWKQVFDNDKYRRPVSERLFKKKELRVLVNSQIDLTRMKSRQKKVLDDNKQLKNKIRDLEEQKEGEINDYKNRLSEQNKKIIECNNQIAALSSAVKEFDKCRKLLDEYIERYQAQIAINESVVIEKKNQLDEIETEKNEYMEKYELAKEKMEEIQRKFEGLESDYNLKSNELDRMKEADEKKELSVRHSLLCELISGLNDQLYYLTCYYLDLKETGHLEPESIELFSDTLNSIV